MSADKENKNRRILLEMDIQEIKKLNEELEQAGYLTVRGRVSRKYYLERIYGGADA